MTRSIKIADWPVEVRPNNTLYLWCRAHDLNLAVVDYCEVTESVHDFLVQIY